MVVVIRPSMHIWAARLNFAFLTDVSLVTIEDPGETKYTHRAADSSIQARKFLSFTPDLNVMSVDMVPTRIR